MTNPKQKHYLVTGATSGIGEAVAMQLAQSDAAIIIVGRNEAKCQQTVAKIRQATPNSTVEYLLADLSRIADCQAVAQAYRNRYPRLDLLINNAGGFFSQLQRSVDGLEMTLATNYLSAFILSTELQSLIEQTGQTYGEARIVNVGSQAYVGALNLAWDDLNFEKRAYAMFGAYAQSKALMIILTQELAKRISTPNCTVTVLHPGTVSTNIGSSGGNIFLKFGYKVFGRFMMTPEKSAQAVCHLALAPELRGVTGKYFNLTKLSEPKGAIANSREGARLWGISQQWLAHKHSV